MKKVLAALLSLTFLFSLSSCSVLGSFFGKDYEAEDEVFQFGKLSITLTEAFYVDEEGSDTVWYESTSETSVSIDRYDLSPEDMLYGLSVMDCAEFFRDSLEYNTVSEVKTDEDLVYVDCEVLMLGFEFFYRLVFFKTTNALYIVWFMCDLDKQETYDAYFTKWAKSIRFS